MSSYAYSSMKWIYVLWWANKGVLKPAQVSGQILVGSVLMWVGVWEMVYGSDKVVGFVLGERNPAIPGKEAWSWAQTFLPFGASFLVLELLW